MRNGLIILLLALAACSQKQVPPAMHDLGLSGAPHETVGVAQITVTAPEWLADYHIHYRLLYNASTQVRAYSLDRWLAPPPELLQQRLLVDGVARSYPLEIELLEFEQQFFSPRQAQVSLRLVARVYSKGEHKLIAARQFALQKASLSPDAKGAVTALADLVKQVSGQLGVWLAGLG